ncbi:hypothetical protein RFI_21594 [Reticulomyxa filosa]|uniref:tRNA-binding domain-containing protein n=1 Tax=Reticulomyxa filosa TaxID=46433 RepID=X6MRP4_RETFI|nr:hypothetical protein RFI_21594 [Reticulomyxa filosa]|eukprot:ETO15770.1 hypothetical protein RFI_21594 [Reticulomyxa filosa]
MFEYIKEKQAESIRTLLECIYVLAHFMEPFTPRASAQVFTDLGTSKTIIPKLKENFENLKPGTKIQVGPVLFKQHTSRFEKKQQTTDRPVIARVDFRVGKVLSVERHPNAKETSYVEKIDIGEPQPRQVCLRLREIGSKAKNISQVVCTLSIPEIGCQWISKVCKRRRAERSACCHFCELEVAKFQQIESQGMLLAASNTDRTVVKPLVPPPGSKVGERLNWSNQNLSQWEPDENVKIKSNKQDTFWEKEIFPTLKTNENGEMSWNDGTFTTSAGIVTAPLKHAKIS